MVQIEVRLCKTFEECLQCEELQRVVWEMPDYRDAVPANLLITAVKNGGILVGAFDGAEMVGFAFGFLGSESHLDPGGIGRHLKHTSYMLGVLPGVRTQGLGARLKFRQREEALAQGLDLMTWTYDPLQALNAYLNLTRLGATARQYLRDAYGDMTDGLNAGVASDRFQVEWALASARVSARAALEQPDDRYPEAQTVYSLAWNDHALPQIIDEEPLQGKWLLVEIPSDINALKMAAPALAVDWRARTRDTFERAFAAGYTAVHVLREHDSSGQLHVCYVLEKSDSQRLY